MACIENAPCMHTVIRRAWLAVLLFAWLGWPAAARAETSQGCVGLTVLPANLFAPGRYCLHKDFSATTYSGGSAILIGHDDIILDCNGHRIAITDAANLLVGIKLQEDMARVTVRNCVVDGFLTGISAESQNLQQGVRIHLHDNTVLNSRYSGINVIGGDVHIERNRVTGISGDFDGSAEGIRVYSGDGTGVGTVVRDNHVSGIRPATIGGKNTTGINVYSLSEPTVTGNTVTAVYAYTAWGVYGIDLTDVAGANVSDNTVMSPPPAAAPLDGVQFYGIRVVPRVGQEGTNVCRDNVVGHFTNNVAGCTTSGNTTF
jgi:hypothetical protein